MVSHDSAMRCALDRIAQHGILKALSRTFVFGLLLFSTFLRLAECQDRMPSPTKTTHATLRSALPKAPIPPITGPGYQDGNIALAFQIGNRRGRDPFRKRTKYHLQNADSNGGNSNYLLTVPILTLPGRGLSVALNLYYNSQVWTNQATNGNYLVFNHDADWPAAGWSLGFGKIVQVGRYRGALVDPDGTTHKYASGQFSDLPNDLFQFTTHTTDGSLIDYQIVSNAEGMVRGTASFPNGTTVTFGARGQNALYATQITDANGNMILIQYRGAKVVGNIYLPSGPPIQSVTDTLGRTINFEYDSKNRLTAITAPGISGGTRTIARFHYGTVQLQYSFATGSQVSAPKKSVAELDGIYFPGTSTGYWFADPDSYSTYGMISKVSQRRAMTFTASSLNDPGTLTAGTMTRERVYNYPNANSGALPDIPKYTTMMESWAGMDVPPAVTTYSVRSEPTFQSIDTTYPDGSHLTQYTYKGGNFDELMYTEIVSDPAFLPLYQTITTWEMGDYDSPIVSGVKVTDKLGQSTTTKYFYVRDVSGSDSPPTNQLALIQQFDYDGKTALRQTAIKNQTDLGYTNRHIFNLPASVTVTDQNGEVVSRTDYAYDHQQLRNAPGVTYHSDASNPYVSGYDPSTDFRGNVTQVTRYKSTYPNWTGIGESRRYDIAGNLVQIFGPCCVSTSYTYSVGTQFAYPEKISRGDINAYSLICAPSSTACLDAAFVYDLNTGLPLTATDLNGLTTRMSYDPATLRLTRKDLPQLPSSILSRAYIEYAYDDAAMSATQTTSILASPFCVSRCTPSLQAQTLTQFNGLALASRVQNLVDGNVWDAVSQQYDARGRLWKTSQPYQLPQPASLWTTYTYDSLGRVIRIQNPNGTQKSVFYSETNRPGSASQAPGLTVRRVDEVGRETWSRVDALGNHVEVVEPAANGTGSVFDDGSVDTRYSYDAAGLLIRVLRGPAQQERDFQYDGLGRLTAEYLAEKSRALDANGNYVGLEGHWSDVFNYDDRSNLVSHTDARGVKTTYSFANDPLNRLESVSFATPSTPGTFDPSSPIPSTPSVAYSYVTSGDLTRPSGVTLSGALGVQEQYGYDAQGLLASKTVLFPGESPLVLTYTHDSLNRLTEEVYPAQYGSSTPGQKILDYTYGVGGFLTDLKINGIDYASQFIYDAAGQATSITVGAPGGQPTIETYNFDPGTYSLQSQTVQQSGSDLMDLAYQYYPNGQLQQLSEGGASQTYDYDALSRLHDVKSTGPYTWSETYFYDSYGNRSSVVASGQGPNGSPIPLDGLAGTPTPPNGLSVLTYDPMTNHVTTPGFGYDAAGNQIRAQRLDGSWVRYQYDQAGRLAETTDDSGKLIEQYAYGADGRRVRESNRTAGTTYFWDGSNVIAEYEQVANLPKWRWSKGHAYLGSRILATFSPSNSGELVQYHHPDRLGVRLITNNLDNSEIEQATLPFGTVLPSGSSDPVNPIFTTYDRSFVTALDYAVNRTYDPGGRFVQVDPSGMLSVNLLSPQTLNFYAYVGNDPVNRLDPYGLQEGGGFGEIQGILTIVGAVAAATEHIGVATCCGVAYGLIELGEAGALASTGIGAALGFDFAVELFLYDQSLEAVNSSVYTVLANSGPGTYASYMNSNQPGNADTSANATPTNTATTGSSDGSTDTASSTEGSITVGGQLGPGVVNSDGSTTYTFVYPDGSTDTYTVPAGSDSGSGGSGGGCATQDTTQDNTKNANASRRHMAKDTEAGCSSN